MRVLIGLGNIHLYVDTEKTLQVRDKTLEPTGQIF